MDGDGFDIRLSVLSSEITSRLLSSDIWYLRTDTPIKICNKIKRYLVSHWISSLWPSDSIWRHKSGTTLARVMACCLTASSHYLSQCWFLDNDVPSPSHHSNFIASTEATRSYDEVQNYISKVIATSPRSQWVKTHCGLVAPYGDKDLGQHWLR